MLNIFCYLIKESTRLDKPPIFILTIRNNQYDKLNYYLDPEIINKTDFVIPDLDDVEINNLILKLDNNNLLGILKGKSKQDRFNEFKYKAKKQIFKIWISLKYRGMKLYSRQLARSHLHSLPAHNCITACHKMEIYINYPLKIPVPQGISNHKYFSRY